MQKKFSNKEIEEKFKHLVLKGWNISEDKIYIQKTYVFKNFKEAFLASSIKSSSIKSLDISAKTTPKFNLFAFTIFK